MKHNFVQRTLSNQYGRVGRIIARKPLYFIMFPLFFTIAFSMGILTIVIERDLDRLYVVTDGRATRNQRAIEELFPTNISSDPLRVPRKRNLIFVMLFPLDGGSMLKEHIFQDILLIEKEIQGIECKWRDLYINYSTVCAKSNNHCFENSIRSLKSLFASRNYRRQKIKYPVQIDPLTFVHTLYVANFGGVTTDEDGIIEDVKAIRLIYVIDDTTEEKMSMSREWEKSLTERMQNRMTSFLSIQVLSSSLVETALSEVSSDLFPFIGIIGLVVAVFCTFTCMTDDWISSKPWFGLSSCISAVLALFSSFGFTMLCGVKFADLNITLPLVILGTEVDNAYIILAAWRRTSPKCSVEKRMEETYSEAAVSVTITSLTNFISFCIGMTTSYPAMQIFCTYAATAIVFAFVYLLSFCGGILALSGYREERGLHPFTCQLLNEQKTSKESKERNGDYPMIFIRDKVGNLLILTNVKILILLAFLVNLAGGIWGLHHLKEGNEMTDGFHDDHVATITLNNNFKYFAEYPFTINIVINQTLNYHLPKVQNQLEEILQNFEKHPHISKDQTTISWLEYYIKFQRSPFSFFLLQGYDVNEKQGFIDGLREVFLNIPVAKQFRSDIIFNNNFTEITTSRFILLSKDVDSVQKEQNLYETVYEIADKSPIPLIIHSIIFSFFELTYFILSAVMQLGLITTGLLIIIFFIFVPDLKCAFIVAVMVLSSMIETVGYMAFWGVRLDIMSTLILILSVGFTINYPAHISFAFMRHTSDSPDEQLKQSLYAVGLPIIQGSLSTILAVAILIYRKSYILNTCFKIVFLVVIHTAFHSLVVIPVILAVTETLLNSRKSIKRKMFK